jgi:hypothetical protein
MHYTIGAAYFMCHRQSLKHVSPVVAEEAGGPGLLAILLAPVLLAVDLHMMMVSVCVCSVVCVCVCVV